MKNILNNIVSILISCKINSILENFLNNRSKFSYIMLFKKALNNSTAGSVIKDVNFSGMVCAVNISTPDFTLDNCVAEEGSKFYLDVMYVDGQSNFIDCLGLLEIYEPNTTSDESEQQAIIAKIHETSPRLVVKFVDA